MSQSFMQKFKVFYFEHGPQRLMRSFYRLLFFLSIVVLVGLIVVTPFYFNNFDYSLDVKNKKFATLVTDPASIKDKLKPMTEKTYRGQLKKEQYSICYVHGFSATRHEIEPVISNLARQLKANLFFTRLSGHGYENPEILKSVKAQDWINDTIECLEVADRSGAKIILIGTSMGAALASLVAANTSYQIHTLILVSPFFGIKDPKADLMAGFLGGYVADLFFKGQRSFKPKNQLQEKFWTTSYPSRVLKQLMIVNMAIREMDFSKLKMPVFLAYSKQDEILDLTQIEIKYDQIVSQKRMDSDPNYTEHVLAGDIMNPKANAQLQKNLYSFIKANN